MDVQGVRVVQDVDFKPKMTLTAYARQARANGGLLVL
jgi:hypothetical protein